MPTKVETSPEAATGPKITLYDASFAAGKKLCGLCGNKVSRKGDWTCTKTIPQPTLKKYELFSHYPCPAPDGDCPGFEKCPQVTKSIQPKPERLAVPPGMIFLYIDRVTIAVLLRGEDVAPQSVSMGFAFCHSGDPKKGIKPDRFCKATGRNEAMKHLYDDPLIAGYLYDPIRIANEVTRAVLDHDLKRLGDFGALLPNNLYKRIPGWTKAIARRFDEWERDLCLVRPRGRHKKPLDLRRVSGISELRPLPGHILGRMLTDIINLDRP